MLDFRIIDISDKDRICRLLSESDFQGCEYSFANNMAWRRLGNSKIAFFKDFYICGAFGNDNSPVFLFPSGKGSYRDVIDELKKFTESIGKPLKMSGVTESGLAVLNELYPNQFETEFDRDSSDYIYNSADLISLAGKKYHKKRNHLAKMKNYEWSFSKMNESDFDDCIAFAVNSYNNKNGFDDYSSVSEQYAINTFFSHFSELNLFGGVIRIDGKVTAFSIGERLCSNTVCVHIEKADTSFDGMYPAINNEFAKTFAHSVPYINREEDMGIDGLRKSKLSYYPAYILSKYIVTFK